MGSCNQVEERWSCWIWDLSNIAGSIFGIRSFNQQTNYFPSASRCVIISRKRSEAENHQISETKRIKIRTARQWAQIKTYMLMNSEYCTFFGSNVSSSLVSASLKRTVKVLSHPASGETQQPGYLQGVLKYFSRTVRTPWAGCTMTMFMCRKS